MTMSGNEVLSCAVLLIVAAVASLQSVDGYVMCPTPIKSPHGGFNVTTVPPNQPIYSNGTDIVYFCDQRYTFTGFTVDPVTCGVDGKWKLYGMNTNCYAIDCSKPLLAKGSGVTVVGTNYSQGATIRYECITGWSTLEPTAICLGPEWSNKYSPWCKVNKCIRLTSGGNSSIIPYGTVTVTKLGEDDPFAPGWRQRIHQYGAGVEYTCQAGTELLGTAQRWCNATGLWTGNMPLCFVQYHFCSVDSQCGSGKVCCEWGGVSAEGLNCCLPPTKAYIGKRISGLTSQCLNNFESNFQPCLTQIIKCLDNTEDTSCISDFLVPDYLYGCNSNLGDLVPQYRSDYTTDKDLVEFCRRDRRAIACTEFQSDYQGSPFSLKARMCLPKTCAEQSTSADLMALAESTLKLRCYNQRKVYKRAYCSISAVTLNCSNGQQATAHHYDGACEQCPPPDGDQRLTECCNFNGKNISCCLPTVNTMVTERQSANTSQTCRSSFIGGLSPCMGIITDCLNSMKDTKERDYICPSYHSCSASSQYHDKCGDYYSGYSSSQWCTMTCSFLDDPSHYCSGDNFCLSQACNASHDIQQLVDSDARFVCDYRKLTEGLSACGQAKVSWSCAAPGSEPRVYSSVHNDPAKANVGLIIGCSIAGVIVLAVIGVIIIKFLVMPSCKSSGYKLHSSSTMKESLISSEPAHAQVGMTTVLPHKS